MSKKLSFITGAAVGAAVTAFLTTENGRIVLDTIKQSALLGLTTLEKALCDKEVTDTEIEDSPKEVEA